MEEFMDILEQVSSPARYLPLELFAYRKDPREARLCVALAFPDTYEVGMSHLGVQILYHLLNQQDWIACDRAYAPWIDLEAKMREKGLPLCGHESGLPLRKFDLLGFSLTYELSYTNVLNMLELAGIPLLSRDRDQGGYPLVIGGGPCAANPEPVADFFDAFLFGDGEEAVLEICRTVLEWKESGGAREELLRALAGIPGLYVPRFFQPEYDEEGRLRQIKPLLPGYEKVERRILADLEDAFFPDRPLVPAVEPVHDRVMLEIMRGCARGCRFCQAGILYRPVRERSPEKILELARKSLAATGYEECSLLALSAGDYRAVSWLLPALIREHYGKRVSVSLPSLRVQALSDPMLRAIESVRKTGFTLAPEAGTERLRKVINKDYEEKELLETAERVFQNGWRNLKLYFMVGLPTETDEDVEAIVALADQVSRIRGTQGRPNITLNLSGFVPKAHTPFQWEPQAHPELLRRRIDRVKRLFRGANKKVRWQNPELSLLEGVMSRGDRRLVPVLLEARKRDIKFDGWSELFNPQAWTDSFKAAGVAPEFYTARKREREEVLPWSHLDARVSKDWLWEERERAFSEQRTPSCMDQGCQEPCGVCDHQRIKPRAQEPRRPLSDLSPPGEKESSPEIFFRYRVKYAKQGPARFLTQPELVRFFSRAVRRAGLPVRYTRGFHKKPKFAFGPPPPVGVASECEFMELELETRLAPDEVGKALAGSLMEGMKILEVVETPPKSPSVSAAIVGFDYLVRWKEPGPGTFSREAAERFLSRDEFVVLQNREKGDREVDIRPLVRRLELRSPGELIMGLRFGKGPGVKPAEVLKHVFSISDEELIKLEIVRIKAWFKQASPVRYDGAAERKRRVRLGSR